MLEDGESRFLFAANGSEVVVVSVPSGESLGGAVWRLMFGSQEIVVGTHFCLSGTRFVDAA